MRHKRLYCIVLLCVTLLILNSCKKKSALSQIISSDADIFFEQPTVQECKSMHYTGRSLSLNKANPASVCGEHTLQKLLDVPLPVDATIVSGRPDFCTQHELSLVRYSSLSQEALYDFYLSMLEQTGWRLVGQSKGFSEYLMVWDKPCKLCVITLEQFCSGKKTGKKPQVRVVIQVCEKKTY